jgi:hypothetical protein
MQCPVHLAMCMCVGTSFTSHVLQGPGTVSNLKSWGYIAVLSLWHTHVCYL